MKIKTLYLENFRCFRDKTEIKFDNLTALIGRNDIGKSTVLEALDVFFNEAKAVNPIKSDDTNINNASKDIIVEVIFDDFRPDIIVDSNVKTTFEGEYLVNEDKKLQIKKVFRSGKLREVALIVYHPINELVKDLLSLKIAELKKRAKEMDIEEGKYDARVSSSIRKAIKENIAEEINFATQEIVIYQDRAGNEKTTAKEIWKQLQDYLPVFSLFQSDRKNEEKDSEVQDPMKAAIKHILKDEKLKDALDGIKKHVEEAAEEVATKTIEKLREMNPDLAKKLDADFSEPTWDSAFKFSIISDENIPLNKRGSGVRRLVLLNFFRAEAEKRKKQRNVPNVIFAVEEPETSQHPNHQQKLIEAFIELTNNADNQVILTTHSPAIAGLLPVSSLRLLKKENKKILCFKEEDTIIKEIAENLGVLPDLELGDITKVKVALCLEGKNDISFFSNLCDSVPELKELVDLNGDDRIIILPMGGSTLQFWVNNDYLSKLRLGQIHIYDSDKGNPNNQYKYKKWVDLINEKGGRNFAFLTEKRELENYFHPDIIREAYNVELEYNTDWDEMDIPEAIAKFNHENSESTKEWSELTKDEIKDKKGKVKNQLNNNHVKTITKDRLVEINAYSEVETWFNKIHEFLN